MAFRRTRSYLRDVLIGLIECSYLSPEKPGEAQARMMESRCKIRDILETSPSMKDGLRSNLQSRWEKAREFANIAASGDVEIPEQCPFTFEQELDEDYAALKRQRLDLC